MKLHEETNRIKNLMRLDEQSNEDSFNEFSAGDFRNLKQFLTSNNELLDKLKPILKKETLKSFDPRPKVFNENKVKELINKKFGSSDSTTIVKDPVLNRRGGGMKKGGTVKSKKKK